MHNFARFFPGLLMLELGIFNLQNCLFFLLYVHLLCGFVDSLVPIIIAYGVVVSRLGLIF